MQAKLAEALKAPLLERIAMYFPLRSFSRALSRACVRTAELLNLWCARYSQRFVNVLECLLESAFDTWASKRTGLTNNEIPRVAGECAPYFREINRAANLLSLV